LYHHLAPPAVNVLLSQARASPSERSPAGRLLGHRRAGAFEINKFKNPTACVGGDDDELGAVVPPRSTRFELTGQHNPDPCTLPQIALTLHPTRRAPRRLWLIVIQRRPHRRCRRSRACMQSSLVGFPRSSRSTSPRSRRRARTLARRPARTASLAAAAATAPASTQLVGSAQTTPLSRARCHPARVPARVQRTRPTCGRRIIRVAPHLVTARACTLKHRLCRLLRRRSHRVLCPPLVKTALVDALKAARTCHPDALHP
jgi:hypothetical protein